MTKARIKHVETTSLKPFEKNSRTHSKKQIEAIARSIKRYGFNDPCQVRSDGTIIVGEGRWRAAQLLKMKQIPIIELGHLDDMESRGYLIAHNKTSDMAGWDNQMLMEETTELVDMGMDARHILFNENEIAQLLAPDRVEEGKIDDDKIPSVKKTPVTIPGDVWILGRHRVICGDSTRENTYVDLLQGDKTDMIWTDPPYNVDYEGGTEEKLKIENDNMEDTAFEKFLFEAFHWMNENNKPGGVIYVAHAETTAAQFIRAFINAGFMHKQTLVWVKSAAALSRQDYNWRHEPILYGWSPGAGHYFCKDFTLNTVIEDPELDVSKLSKRDLVDLLERIIEMKPEDVIHVDKPSKNKEHPTMKPVELVQEMIENSSRPGALVLDAFGGSGSTLIACEKAGRSARLIEYEPRFTDVIVDRWQQFTGFEATLAQTGQTFDEVKKRGRKA
jgi:DNA modification methylase